MAQSSQHRRGAPPEATSIYLWHDRSKTRAQGTCVDVIEARATHGPIFLVDFGTASAKRLSHPARSASGY